MRNTKAVITLLVFGFFLGSTFGQSVQTGGDKWKSGNWDHVQLANGLIEVSETLGGDNLEELDDELILEKSEATNRSFKGEGDVERGDIVYSKSFTFTAGQTLRLRIYQLGDYTWSAVVRPSTGKANLRAYASDGSFARTVRLCERDYGNNESFVEAKDLVGDEHYGYFRIRAANTTTFTVDVYKKQFLESEHVELSNYTHYNQFDKWSGAPSNLLACGQTSYMVARHMVDPSKSVNSSALEDIHDRLSNFGSYNPEYYASVYMLSVLANGNRYNDPDFGPGGAEYYSGGSYSSHRNQLKSFILDSLESGKPVLVPVEYKFNTGAIGHFLVVVGLHLTDTGSGSIIYYKDVAGDDDSTKTVDYTVLLDSNVGNSNGYVALRLNGN